MGSTSRGISISHLSVVCILCIYQIECCKSLSFTFPYLIISLQLDPLQSPSVQTSIWEDEHGNLDGDEDFRLTLFIASSSIIILSLITIIGVVSCFILCNDEPVSFTLNTKPESTRRIRDILLIYTTNYLWYCQISVELHQIFYLNYATHFKYAFRNRLRLVV